MSTRKKLHELARLADSEEEWECVERIVRRWTGVPFTPKPASASLMEGFLGMYSSSSTKHSIRMSSPRIATDCFVEEAWRDSKAVSDPQNPYNLIMGILVLHRQLRFSTFLLSQSDRNANKLDKGVLPELPPFHWQFIEAHELNERGPVQIRDHIRGIEVEDESVALDAFTATLESMEEDGLKIVDEILGGPDFRLEMAHWARQALMLTKRQINRRMGLNDDD